jgi:uncharacterized membrane protein YfcA
VTTIALFVLGLPIGFLIGLIGIGGVLLTPALAHLLGQDIHDAVSLSLASFVAAGAMAAASARKADASLLTGDWYLLGALVPGALVGTFATRLIPATALSLVISVCVVMAGLSCLRATEARDKPIRDSDPPLSSASELPPDCCPWSAGPGGRWCWSPCCCQPAWR